MLRLPLIAALGLFGLVVLGFGESWLRTLEAVSAFRLHLGVLAAVMALAFMMARRRAAAGVAGLAAVLAVGSLGPVWQPAERSGPENGARLSLLFANVYMFNPDPPVMIDALIAADADVLVTVETPDAVIERLSAHYPFRVLEQQRGTPVRVAIWSRLPLEPVAVNLDDNAGPVAAAAVVRAGENAPLGLIGAHFMRAWLGLTPGQLDGFAGMVGLIDAPLVLAADLNAAPWSRLVAEAATVSGTEPLGGYRVTWRGRYPGGLPEPWGHQIDHILAAPEIGLIGLRTVAIPGSDHRGLFLTLNVPRSADPSLSAATDHRYPMAETR